MDPIVNSVSAIKDELLSLRRDFHKHPELGFEEFRTSGIIREYLGALGIETAVLAKTGVVGLIKGAGEGPTLMLRADIDALPVEEQTELPFKSVNAGKMHACGHDGHAAMLLAAAKIIAQNKDKLKGNVKLVFQPNEENGGAEQMISEGVLEDPKVDFCFGVHLWQPTPDGKLGLSSGPVMAGHDNFKITVKGKGGHSGQPHMAIDPVVAAAAVIMNLQFIQTRGIDVLLPTAIMVNMLKAGTAPNVIGDTAEICGSLRYLYDDDDTLPPHPRRRLEDIARSTCAVYGATCDVEFIPSSATLINDKAAVDRIRPVAESVFGTENIIPSVFMMGEDFSSFTNRVPGVFAFVGVGSDEKNTNYPHHHPKFNIDEDVLPRGVELFVKIALDFLK